MDLKSEQRLIRAAQRGDESAASELYRLHVDKIYRYLLYRVASHEIAEDLTSEVFMRFVEGLAAYQDRNVPLLAWLYRIAHARLVDHYRKKRIDSIDADVEAFDLHVDDNMDDALMNAHRQETVQAALGQLKDEQRQVLILRFIEGYNLQETAEVVGKSIGAVKVIQHRALRVLSQLLVQEVKADEK